MICDVIVGVLQDQSTRDELSNAARSKDAEKLGGDMKGLQNRMSSLETNFQMLHNSVTDMLSRQPGECSAMEAFHRSAVELFGRDVGDRIAGLASEETPY